MEISSKVWESDWRKKVMTRIRAAGCATVTEYLASSPKESYLKAAAKLGDDVAAFQLEWIQFDEATDPKSFRTAAMDSLVREMDRHLLEGWKQESGTDFDTARALRQLDW